MQSMRIGSQSRRGGLAVLALGIGALSLTVGCAGKDARDLTATSQVPGSTQGALPVVVSCEPNQRAMMRPAVVNGAAVSQIECISAAAPVAAPIAAAPVSPVVPASYVQPRVAPVVYDEAPARIVRTSDQNARVVRTNQVIDERPVRRARSVKKSALIIGGSAGAGAGIGAAIGGKKGALIGAAIGGGGATVWDQITRRR
jgi:hypothetical protein